MYLYSFYRLLGATEHKLNDVATAVLEAVRLY
jgi:anti-sigma regulatory factor (Ser/Thr protein kinase)